MKYSGTFFSGVKKVFQGFSFINKNHLWAYIIIPLAATLAAAFFLKTALSFLFSAEISHLLEQWFPGIKTIPFLGTLISVGLFPFFFWLMSFLNLVLYFIIGSLTWGFFAGSFQEKAFFILSGRKMNLSLPHALKWALMALLDTLKDLFVLIVCYAFSLLFILLPVLGGIFSWFLILWLSAFLIGRTQFRSAAIFYAETPSERKNVLRKIRGSQMTGLGILEVLAAYLPSFLSIPAYFLLWAGASAGAVMALNEEREQLQEEKIS